MLCYDEKPNGAGPDARVFHRAKIDHILDYVVKIEAQPTPTPDQGPTTIPPREAG